MDSHKDLVDVLLLSHCNVYERYPELVERVDYFLHEWSEKLLARTESLLRKQSRSLRNMSAKTSSVEDESFTHSRSLNVVWRQWAVCRLQLPRYPPEHINWNKDADPVFLYGQTPVVRLEVPWSEHSLAVGQRAPINPSLKPAIKRTDLQTFLTSPTLSPVASPPYSPLHSPALSVRESMSTSSLTSDSTLENDMSPQTLKPRLRFNDKVEQCMVVFNQEKEYLPTDYEDDCDDDNMKIDGAAPLSANLQRHARRSRHSGSMSRSGRGRHTLVIKLAPTHLKGDHRNIAAATASSRLLRHPFGSRGRRYSSEYGSDDDEESFYYGYDGFYNDDDDDDDEEEDPFADTFTSFGRRRQTASERTVSSYTDGPANNNGRATGVSGYVQGCVQSVAGQVRKLVSDAVAVSSFTAEKPAKSQRHLKQQDHQTANPEHVVSDPFASYQQRNQRQNATDVFVGVSAKSDDDKDSCITHMAVVDQEPTPCGTPGVTASSSSDVVRDPFASTPRHPQTDGGRTSADHVPFDDDEDAIIQQFEREMQKYNVNNGGNNVSHQSQCRHHVLPTERQNSYPKPNGTTSSASSADHQKHDNDHCWDDSEYDMYGSEYNIHNGMDDDEDNEFGFGHDGGGSDYSSRFNYSAYNKGASAVHSVRSVSGVQQSPASAVVKDPFSSASSARESSSDIIARANGRNVAPPLPQTEQHLHHGRARNESIIDRAEDTIVNTVDAVKWCASFISNYTIF
ncbi:protein phosphatase regulator [Coemansia sp. RSA 1646]|nr:protein phosphatase regulator [Coemansia sp. RSA 1646]